MHIVYNGKYLEYFEVGRTEMLRELGLPYSRFEREGFRLPLIDAFCRYHSPARYDDLLDILSSVEEYHTPRLRIEYRIVQNGTGHLLVSGYTTHAFVKTESGKPVRPPGIFLDVFSKALEGSAFS